MFKLNTKKTIVEKVKGIFSMPIKYEVRVPDGDWTPYFGKYQNQRWGLWDSNSCWCLSAINCAEDQLEWLYKNGMFTQEAKEFFIKEGYIDEDGDFSLSERYIEILSGVHDNGNNQMEAWRLMQDFGCIPRKDLTYTVERANKFAQKLLFNADYFNMAEITEEMTTKAKKFKSYVSIARQWIGDAYRTPDAQIIKAALKQAPLQIGVPVPNPSYLWNNEKVVYAGEKTVDHAIELYKFDDTTGEYCIFDQYIPNLKRLSKNYYIPFITQGILYAIPQAIKNPIPQDEKLNSFWGAVMDWFNGIINPNIPVGGENFVANGSIMDVLKAHIINMKNNIVAYFDGHPKVESAITTFVSFFLIDLAASVQNLAHQHLSAITWGVIWGGVISAGRSAIKEIWVWYKTPTQS
jgi:hypothetical protein